MQVVLALAMATQVDGARLHVDIHQVVNDPALDVVLHAVDEEPAAHVDHLDEGQVPEDARQERATLTSPSHSLASQLPIKCEYLGQQTLSV